MEASMAQRGTAGMPLARNVSSLLGRQCAPPPARGAGQQTTPSSDRPLEEREGTDASSWLATSSCSSHDDTCDLGTVVVDRSIAIDCGGTRCKIVCFHREVSTDELPSYVSVDHGPRVPIAEHNYAPSPLQYLTMPTKRLPDWLDWCRNNHTLVHYNSPKEVYATGGGAFKYKEVLKDKLGVTLIPLSEMRTLVDGLNLLLTVAPSREVFEYDWQVKVKRPVVGSGTRTYPYLITSIGSGVSIIKVTGEGEWERVSGSCVGGGTFWGLSKLLTDIETWDELEDVRQVEGEGDNREVDLLVGDIYGKRCMKTLGLGENVIASSFGKCGVCSSEEEEGWNSGHNSSSFNCADGRPAPAVAPMQTGANARRKKFRKKGGRSAESNSAPSPTRGKYHTPDICRSLLLMVANNVGQITYLNARIHGVENIYFTGGFTHDNPYVWSKLSYAINFWSKGEMTARFLEHDGYLGALGALVHSDK